MSGDAARARRILLPVDGSDSSRQAVDWYLDEVAEAEDQVYILHVIEPCISSPAVGFMSYTPIHNLEVQAYLERCEESGKTICKCYRDLVREKTAHCEAYIQLDTSPGSTIVRFAESMQIELVVIGSRGLGAIKRMLIGSVSNHVLHHSKIPIIIVPHKK